jgi:hypothetical protein
MHMPDSSSYPDAGDAPGLGPNRESTTGTPRWLRLFAIVALVLVVLVVVMLVVVGGHGPGRH